VLSDVEFVDAFSTQLGLDYRKAKSFVTDVPTQALLHIRSFSHKLTSLLAEKHAIDFDSPNLYDRIELLDQRRLIDVKVARILHKLRTDGNRGAHPEKYHLTPEQLQQLSQRAIKQLLQLVKLLFYAITNTTAPAYYFEDFDTLAGRDLCYRAVMEQDVESQYLVGMSLKARALMQKEQELALQEPHEKDLEERSIATLRQASYWFAQAAEHHADALYEHGVALLHGYNGELNPIAGEQAIAKAAEQGVINAMALLGYFYLVGSQSFNVDLQLAEQYLTEAAKQEHSEALANLGVLYYQQSDLSSAYQYINRAAKAGSPHAQYHLSLMLARGEGCEIDSVKSQHWLTEAAEQGQLDAMLARAQSMLHDDPVLTNNAAHTTDYTLAETYLREVIKYGHSVAAMMELSVALADGVLGRIDVVASASLLKLAKAHANDDELAVIEPLWASLDQQIQSVMLVTQSTAEQAALAKAAELLSN